MTWTVLLVSCNYFMSALDQLCQQPWCAAVLQPDASFHYPQAEASHEDVINNPDLFHATLKKVSPRVCILPHDNRLLS